ncbi:hypothetical protein F5Y08DRAFT_337116 [Xylaria arbuscula]|nr:hypothetical protein F5Y08DRAFT_337116 [Xylaria arbuscula]
MTRTCPDSSPRPSRRRTRSEPPPTIRRLDDESPPATPSLRLTNVLSQSETAAASSSGPDNESGITTPILTPQSEEESVLSIVSLGGEAEVDDENTRLARRLASHGYHGAVGQPYPSAEKQQELNQNLPPEESGSSVQGHPEGPLDNVPSMTERERRTFFIGYMYRRQRYLERLRLTIDYIYQTHPERLFGRPPLPWSYAVFASVDSSDHPQPIDEPEPD